MRIIAITLSLLALSFLAIPPSHAQTFKQPEYKKGTTFEIRQITRTGRVRHKTMVYGGMRPDGRYDFGKWSLSRYMVLQKSSTKKEHPRQGIKFPFTFGDTWSYSYDFDTKSARCGIFSRSFKATVAEKMSKATVGDHVLDIVKVHHEGRWECSNNHRSGRFTWDYEYSPKLGMYVSDAWRRYRGRDGAVHSEGEKRLIDFNIPGTPASPSATNSAGKPQ